MDVESKNTNRNSVRMRGGRSRSLDFLISEIRRPVCEREDTPKAGALLDLTPALLAIIEQAKKNDGECGSFLGELTTFLSKNKADLALRNKEFAATTAKWKVRSATTKDSALRHRVHDVLLSALSRRKRYNIAYAMGPEIAELYAEDAPLRDLPEFRDDPQIIAQWHESVIYPEFYKQRKHLANDPAIGHIRKAYAGGKFQISRLKRDIFDTLGRLAKLPQSFYFRIS